MPENSLIPNYESKKLPDGFPRLGVRDRVRGYLPSREQIVNFLKNLVWVAPLTLLIWIYAEREQSVAVSGLVFPIEVHTSDDRIVKLRGPNDKNVVLELSGPRVKVDHVRELLQARPDGSTGIQIFVDPKIGAGGQPSSELGTVEQLNNLAVFKNNGITVKSAQPPYLVVDIDTYETRDLPVKAPPEIAGFLGDLTHFVPDTIQVRAPSHDFEISKSLFVYAELAKHEEIKTKTGPYSLDNVPVYWPPDGNAPGRRENVTYTPRLVSAKLDVKPRDVTYEIPTVPIYKETPQDFEKRFYVDFRPTIANVGVMGPPEPIEAIRKGDFKVRARLELTTLDNRLDIPETRALQLDLPPGVTLTKDGREHATTTFTLRDISTVR